jgi:hypothetical protein
MAKLSANGPELLRVSREAWTADGSLKSESTTYEKVIRVYHTNGVILEKRTVRFNPNSITKEDRLYTWGWKKIIAAKQNPQPIEKAKLRLTQYTAEDSRWVVEFKSPQLDI